MTLLVCEGRCNPRIREIDRAIVTARSRSETSNGMLTTLELLLEIRRLVHTEHTQHAPDWYVCTICGTARRCGGSFWSFAPPASSIASPNR